jgi:hypothetical protein
MYRVALVFAVAAAGLTTQASAQGRVTQIEPRPTYGATVTIEEGVRVVRPCPAGTRHVIVNPNRTPLMLDIGETGAVNHATSQSNVVVDRRRY